MNRLFFVSLLLPFTIVAGDLTPAGVGNFHQVDPNLYRGAQPTPEGLKNLSKLGVKVVVDLREGQERGTDEKKLVEADGMRYVSIPMHGLSAPTRIQIDKVFSVLNDSNNWPVFVHCKHGVDRTGTVVACYRIAHDRWPNQKAVQEANLYGMHKVEWAMRQFILHFPVPSSGEPTPEAVPTLGSK